MSTDPLLGDHPVERSDKICYEPSLESISGETQDYLIYFIPGNPGLIPYYQPFLWNLHSELLSSSSSYAARFHICGHSLRGFEFDQKGQFDKVPSSPVGLEGQITFQEHLLYKHVRSHRVRTGNNPKVILMGHSVGAYILLEIIQRHQGKIDEGEEDFDLIGGILLFPTITEIAQSPLGTVASKVLKIPYLPETMGFLAKLLSSLLPRGLFYRLVKSITRFPEYAAQATVSFIKSPMGVRQALHMARDEMRFITGDKWDQEVWGAATSEGTNERDTVNSNLYLYWGKADVWVANHTRDALIERRGHKSPVQPPLPHTKDSKPRMIIDDKGMPHDFCTTKTNSIIIAEKVKTWVDEIIVAHRKIVT